MGDNYVGGIPSGGNVGVDQAGPVVPAANAQANYVAPVVATSQLGATTPTNYANSVSSQPATSSYAQMPVANMPTGAYAPAGTQAFVDAPTQEEVKTEKQEEELDPVIVRPDLPVPEYLAQATQNANAGSARSASYVRISPQAASMTPEEVLRANRGEDDDIESDVMGDDGEDDNDSVDSNDGDGESEDGAPEVVSPDEDSESENDAPEVVSPDEDGEAPEGESQEEAQEENQEEPLEAVASDESPDQKKYNTNPDGYARVHHDRGSATTVTPRRSLEPVREAVTEQKSQLDPDDKQLRANLARQSENIVNLYKEELSKQGKDIDPQKMEDYSAGLLAFVDSYTKRQFGAVAQITGDPDELTNIASRVKAAIYLDFLEKGVNFDAVNRLFEENIVLRLLPSSLKADILRLNPDFRERSTSRSSESVDQTPLLLDDAELTEKAEQIKQDFLSQFQGHVLNQNYLKSTTFLQDLLDYLRKKAEVKKFSDLQTSALIARLCLMDLRLNNNWELVAQVFDKEIIPAVKTSDLGQKLERAIKARERRHLNILKAIKRIYDIYQKEAETKEGTPDELALDFAVFLKKHIEQNRNRLNADLSALAPRDNIADMLLGELCLEAAKTEISDRTVMDLLDLIDDRSHVTLGTMPQIMQNQLRRDGVEDIPPFIDAMKLREARKNRIYDIEFQFRQSLPEEKRSDEKYFGSSRYLVGLSEYIKKNRQSINSDEEISTLCTVAMRLAKRRKDVNYADYADKLILACHARNGDQIAVEVYDAYLKLRRQQLAEYLQEFCAKQQHAEKSDENVADKVVEYPVFDHENMRELRNLISLRNLGLVEFADLQKFRQAIVDPLYERLNHIAELIKLGKIKEEAEALHLDHASQEFRDYIYCRDNGFSSTKEQSDDQLYQIIHQICLTGDFMTYIISPYFDGSYDMPLLDQKGFNPEYFKENLSRGDNWRAYKDERVDDRLSPEKQELVKIRNRKRADYLKQFVNLDEYRHRALLNKFKDDKIATYAITTLTSDRAKLDANRIRMVARYLIENAPMTLQKLVDLVHLIDANVDLTDAKAVDQTKSAHANLWHEA